LWLPGEFGLCTPFLSQCDGPAGMCVVGGGSCVAGWQLPRLDLEVKTTRRAFLASLCDATHPHTAHTVPSWCCLPLIFETEKRLVFTHSHANHFTPDRARRTCLTGTRRRRSWARGRTEQCTKQRSGARTNMSLSRRSRWRLRTRVSPRQLSGTHSCQIRQFPSTHRLARSLWRFRLSAPSGG